MAERELSGQLLELERENKRLREDLAGWAPHPPVDRRGEPVYDEARRVARLRSDSDLSFLSTDDQARA